MTEEINGGGNEMLRGDDINLQWFPGHMAKTRRLIAENLKLVDIVIEILDARIPESSKNPIIDELIAAKPRLLVLNKADLANAEVNRQWLAFYAREGIEALLLDSKTGKGINEIMPAARRALERKLTRDKSRGMNKAVRAMIAGIPNVGKSSLINRLAGERRAKVEDRPGVTRNKQWVQVFDGALLLLDTPGILWPKFEDKSTAQNLAFTGAIRDDIYDMEAVAAKLLLRLQDIAPDALCERYKLEEKVFDAVELLTAVGRKRGMLIAGGNVDLERTARMVLDEFRGIKIAKISLEKPEA